MSYQPIRLPPPSAKEFAELRQQVRDLASQLSDLRSSHYDLKELLRPSMPRSPDYRVPIAEAIHNLSALRQALEASWPHDDGGAALRDAQEHSRA